MPADLPVEGPQGLFMAKIMCCKSLVLTAAGGLALRGYSLHPINYRGRKPLRTPTKVTSLTVIHSILGGVLLIQGMFHPKPRNSFARGLGTKAHLGQGGGFEPQGQTECLEPCPCLRAQACAVSSPRGPGGRNDPSVRGESRIRLVQKWPARLAPCESPLFPPFRLSGGSPTHGRPLCGDHKVTGVHWALSPRQAGLLTSPP